MPATFANYHRPSKDSAKRFAEAPSVTLDTVDVEDVADELLEVSAPAAAVEKTATSPRTRTARGNWLDALRRSDVKALWTELHRLVSYHPLVRASWSAGLLIETDAHSNRANANVDLTQELFVTLLSKQRFQHYLDAQMTDAEIECEIGQIELTNLLTAELRKRHPESYRLARRISTIIQTSPNFRRFDVSNEKLLAGEEEPHRRLADRVYGLSEWQHGKPRRGAHDMDRRAHLIPMRARDTRLVGCTGDAQIIISNADLENLIVSILEAIDAPADVRALRGLVMARLPVMDIYLVPLGGDDDDDDKKRVFEPVDLGETPEQSLLRREREDVAANCVEGFLKSLHQTVRGKAKQYERMLGVLWYCYLNPDQITQLEAAARLGVSDSLISDYRRRIEAELRALAFGELEEARCFERALREHVETLVTGDVTSDAGIAV